MSHDLFVTNNKIVNDKIELLEDIYIMTSDHLQSGYFVDIKTEFDLLTYGNSYQITRNIFFEKPKNMVIFKTALQFIRTLEFSDGGVDIITGECIQLR